MQAASAAESETERDWNPDPTYLFGRVWSIPVIPIEKSAADRSEVDSVRSSPIVLPTEMGRAIPSDTIRSMCCREEKNRGPFGGVCDDEYRSVFFLVAIEFQFCL